MCVVRQVTVSNKADRIVAERAARHRHQAKLEHRRRQYKDSLQSVVEEERLALMRKHGVDGSESKFSV